ncbi:MAG: hypothetical protein ACPIEU_00980 [Candidatus Puniceispirillaceae bacterium]
MALVDGVRGHRLAASQIMPVIIPGDVGAPTIKTSAPASVCSAGDASQTDC